MNYQQGKTIEYVIEILEKAQFNLKKGKDEQYVESVINQSIKELSELLHE